MRLRGKGNDRIDGGAGDDTLAAMKVMMSLVGGDGNDIVADTQGDNVWKAAPAMTR